MRPGKRRQNSKPDEAQLRLALAWLEPDAFGRALAARGVVGIERIRYKRNRTRLISLSADQRSLNLHECFRGAPDPVIDAIATFLIASPGSKQQRRAVHTMRVWSEGQAPEDGAVVFSGRPCAGSEAQQEFILTAYQRLNDHLFEGRLPPVIPIRLSNRMARRFGHVEYRRRAGARQISELALNVDLLIHGNEKHLLDTLLHEMAHVEAWVLHGHRGHGATWKRIARRVGCEVRALSWVRIRRRREGDVADVPDLDALLARARRNAPAGSWRAAAADEDSSAGDGTAYSLAGMDSAASARSWDPTDA